MSEFFVALNFNVAMAAITGFQDFVNKAQVYHCYIATFRLRSGGMVSNLHFFNSISLFCINFSQFGMSLQIINSSCYVV